MLTLLKALSVIIAGAAVVFFIGVVAVSTQSAPLHAQSPNRPFIRAAISTESHGTMGFVYIIEDPQTHVTCYVWTQGGIACK